MPIRNSRAPNKITSAIESFSNPGDDALEQFNRESIQRRKSLGIGDFANMTQQAADNAANAAQQRNRSDLADAENYATRSDNRNLEGKLKLMQAESNLKGDGSGVDFGSYSKYMASERQKENDRNKSNLDYARQVAQNQIDRQTTIDEADKNRTQSSLQSALNRDLTERQSNADRNLRQNLAEIEHKTKLEQARIAAQSQISSSIFSNRQSYGGYW
jgi:hypothetical protein